MIDFLLGLALGTGCAIIVWVGLFEANRMRAGGPETVERASQRSDEFRRVARGPFQS